MRAVVRLLLLIWASVSAVSLVGLIYVFPSYSLNSALPQALRKPPSPQASFWFHWCVTFFLVGACMTAWLYRTYRKQYGKPWKSD
jgi:membrane protein implicated in regulation of membrane protease activity